MKKNKEKNKRAWYLFILTLVKLQHEMVSINHYAKETTF